MDLITRLFSDHFIEVLGWTVLHSIWQATLIAIFVGILLLMIQKKSAKIRYGIAIVGMFGILLSAVGTFFWLYASTKTDTVSTELSLSIQETFKLSTEVPIVQSFVQQSQSYFSQHLPLIVGLWLVGFAFFVLRLMGGLLYIQHLRKRSVELKDTQWLQLLDKLANQLPTKKVVALAESAMISTPLVIGHIKPLILFPIGMINHLSVEEVEAILAHELAHIYRNDYLINIIQSVIETLFYYHPAVWWLSWIIQTEREHCCDDIAVQVSGSSLNYAKALLRLQELSQTYSPALAMSFAGRKNQLLSRIQRLLNHPQKNSNVMEKLIATGLLTLAVCLFSLHADAKKPTKETTIIEFPKIDKNPAISAEKISAVPTCKPAKIIPLTNITPFLPKIEIDTIPSSSKKTNRYSYYFNDGKTYEVQSKNGQITSMKVNGTDIPEAEYDKYQQQFKKNHRTPKPPAPPSFPMPPAPPAMPALPAPPAPPVPPNFSFDGSYFDRIKKEVDKDGNTILNIKSDDGEETVKIKIVDGSPSSFYIDGRELREEEVALLEQDLEDYIEYAVSDWIEENSDYFEGDLEEWAEEFGESMGEWGEEFGASVEQWFGSEKEQSINQEELEVYQEEMELLREEAEVRKMELFEEQQEELKRLKEEMEEKRRAYRERLQELREEERERMEEERERMEEERERMEELQEEATEHRQDFLESLEEGLEQIVTKTPSFKANQSVYEQLLVDGFAKDGKKFSYKLSQKTLSINGKKQSKATHKKYLSIYEQELGRPLKDRDRISISGKMNRADNSFRGNISISDQEELRRL